MPVIPIVVGAFGKENWRIRHQENNEDHPNDSVVNIGLNTEDSSGVIKRLVVIQAWEQNSPLEQRKNRDHSEHNIVEISQNINGSLTDRRRLTVT